MSPTALIQQPRALPCDIAAIIYCQRKGSPDVFQLLRQSFLVISPVRHLLSHRKQQNPDLVRQYSVLHLVVHLQLKMYFLLSQHLHQLTTLTRKKSRLNNRRRRFYTAAPYLLSNNNLRKQFSYLLQPWPTLSTPQTP